MGTPFPSGLVAAKQASRIAWVFNNKGERNVWVAEAPKFAAHQITHYRGDSGQTITSLRLTSDGRTVIYVRGSELNKAGRVADPTSRLIARRQQVWAVDVDGEKEPRILGEMGCASEGCEDVEISPDGQFALWSAHQQLWIAAVYGVAQTKQLTELRGNNIYPRWSPDGHRISFVSARNDHSFIAIYDFGSDSVRYVAPSTNRDIVPRWSPDGRSLAFIRIHGGEQKVPLIAARVTPWSIWVAKLDQVKAQEVWRSGEQTNDSFPELTEEVPFFFASNDRIVFASEQDGQNHLYSILTTGGLPVLLTPGNFDVEDVSLGADGDSLLYSSNQDDSDRRHIWKVSLTDGKTEPITSGKTIEWSPVETGHENVVVCLGSTATTPAMPYFITKQGRKMIAESASFGDFPSNLLIEPKPVIFQSEDGVEVHGQLFLPVEHNKKTAAVIFTHGGPRRQMLLGFHYMEYYHNAYAMNQYLAMRGYVVLSVNYRLGIMYGRAFREPANSSWRGAAEYQDVVAAGKFLRNLPEVDAERIGLWGGSYGGYLTAMGLARNSDLFAAGVDFHGVHDWSALPELWDEVRDSPDFAAARSLAFKSSPIATISKWKSPVLLIHGDDDRNVVFSQTVDIMAKLINNGVHAEELVLPDEVHDFLLWKNWVRSYQVSAEFLDRVLKNRVDAGSHH